jgi:uncharacterized membrane protein
MTTRYTKHIKTLFGQNNLLLKTILYRIFATICTIIIAFTLTGSLTLSLSVGGIDLVSKLFIYYIYEIFWKKITKQ